MYHRYDGGWIEIVCGSMFSGKTEELIRRIKRAEIARQKVQVFKPKLDDRYQAKKLSSHGGSYYEAIVVKNAAEISAHLCEDTGVIAIDEVQFFDWTIAELCVRLADEGRRVILAGLDMDFRGEPFWSNAFAHGPGRGCRQTSGNLYGLRCTGQPHAAVDRRSSGQL